MCVARGVPLGSGFVLCGVVGEGWAGTRSGFGVAYMCSDYVVADILRELCVFWV